MNPCVLFMGTARINTEPFNHCQSRSTIIICNGRRLRIQSSVGGTPHQLPYLVEDGFRLMTLTPFQHLLGKPLAASDKSGLVELFIASAQLFQPFLGPAVILPVKVGRRFLLEGLRREQLGAFVPLVFLFY